MKKLLYLAIALFALWLLSVMFKEVQKQSTSLEEKQSSSEILKDNTQENEFSDCQEFIDLYSAEYLSKEYGKSEMWVLNNVKINLWQKESSQGKGRKVGVLLPGSRAQIITEGINDYKVKSPYDKSIGWVSKIQVNRTLLQSIYTFEPCG